MKKIILILTSLLISHMLSAQHMSGFVYGTLNKKEIPLQSASVKFAGGTNGVYTDDKGYFNLPLHGSEQLVISYIGYKADTIEVGPGDSLKIVLAAVNTLKGITVKAARSDGYISQLQTVKSEVVTSSGLQKNACCNLAESFSSNPTVDATSSDAVTGQKQIQMLGLAGTYVQMETDLLPTIRGLNAVTALNDIPGAFVKSINIRKGAGSVANGFESMTGQIDVELLKPMEADKFFVNGYFDDEQRMEGNLYFRNNLKKWSALTMLHGSGLQHRVDNNNDSFSDKPEFERYSIIHRWQYLSNTGKETHIGVKAMYNDSRGGNYNNGRFNDSVPFAPYNVKMKYNREEVFAKTDLSVGKKLSELGLQGLAVRHGQENIIGLHHYTAQEYTGWVNGILQLTSADTKSILRVGGGAFYNHYSERLDAFDFSRIDFIPGVFTEYTYDNLKKFSLIAGVRADALNTDKIFVSPRLHMRYKVSREGSVRASVGSGWRVAHAAAENMNYLISNRSVNLTETLRPEQSWNFGINYTQGFDWWEREAELSIDVYRTDFVNQVIADVDANAHQLLFYNLQGKSFSNSGQAQFKYEVIKNLTALVAAKYNDAQTTYSGRLMQKPFSPKWRGLFNVSYAFWKDKLKLDATLQYVGEQRIPNLTADQPLEHPQYAPSYVMVLGQASFTAKNFEVYAGTEDLNNYVQPNPIVDALHPYSSSFDASQVWAPVAGRMFYAGFRFHIK